MQNAVSFFRDLFFDEEYYLTQKAEALSATSSKNWTNDDVCNAIVKAGMTPWEHYVRYGAFEYDKDGNLGLDPSKLFSTSNYYKDFAELQDVSAESIAASLTTDPITDYAVNGYASGVAARSVDSARNSHTSRVEAYRDFYFNETEYIENKTAALNADGGNGNWTAEKTLNAITKAGMTPFQHFCKYGAYEKGAGGDTGIDPSSYFDVSRYYEDKAATLGSTADAMRDAFKTHRIDPITHYAKYGYLEHIAPVHSDLECIDASDALFSVPLSDNLLVDALLIPSWSIWPNMNAIGLNQNNIIYYHCPTQSELRSLDISYGGSPLTLTQKTGYIQAMQALNDITGVRFAETADMDVANLLFFTAYKPGNGSFIDLGWTSVDQNVFGRNVQAVILNDSRLVNGNADPTFGQDSFATVLHELGHAMGLKHSFSTEGINLATLPDSLENTAWSIMSYTSGNEQGENWYSAGEQYFSPVDVLALHYLYGTDGLNGSEGLTYDDIGV
ncbi:MAG: hypothetical protein K5657_09000 [Desulfovibrio sp.]|nr:hypothetical protein [Desulfovibrio sp.]